MKEKLTLIKALDLSIELWAWLAETGGKKEDWSRRDEFNDVLNDCFLCEYDSQSEGEGFEACPYCPLMDRGDCYGYSYREWERARTTKSRKKYAKLFLEELKQKREELK